MKGFAVAIVLGVLTGLWLVNKLPVLRGGMHFEAAPTVAEQLASAQSAKIQVSPDREAHMRRQGARLTFETAFRSTLTLEARQALVAETIAALLPDDWPRALEILIEHSRYPVDPELLAEILKAGGEDAFTMAAQSHRVGIGSLGHALRLAELPDKNRLVAEFIANATVNERGLPFFVIESYDSENPDQSALVAAVKALIEKNPQLNFERLVKGVADAKQLNSKEILAALKPLARNAYQESLVSNQERMLRREAYDTAADNPEIAGISEMRRHLSVETSARLSADGVDATLDWAMTLDPKFRTSQIREALSRNIYSDGLSPLLIALQRNAESPQPELLAEAIQLSGKAPLETNPETFDAVTQLAADSADVAKVLERFEEAAEKERSDLGR